MKATPLIVFFFAQLMSANADIFLPVSNGMVSEGGGADPSAYIAIAPTSGDQGDLQFASFNSTAYSTILLELNSYDVPPLSGNPVLVYGYDNASGTLSQSDYNAGTYLGAWTFPQNLLPGQPEYFNVTAFVQSVQGSYFGFDLRSDEGVDIFSTTAKNYGTPPELVATVPEPAASTLLGLAAAVLGIAEYRRRTANAHR